MIELNHDSKEELHFSWWLEELVQLGYIINYEKSQTYELSDKLCNIYREELKTKSKEKSEELIKEHVYTPDFTIKWSEKAIGVFAMTPGKKIGQLIYSDLQLVSVIEIKASFDNNNMTRLNTINRKWMLQKHGIFVDLIKIPDIFKETFTPLRYIKTDMTLKPRKIKFKVRYLSEFLKS